MNAHRSTSFDRLERWARGELSAQEEAELLKEAKRDPELAQDMELYRPLDAQQLRLVEAKIQRSTRRQQEPDAPRWSRFWRPAGVLAMAMSAAVVVGLKLRPAESPLAPYSLSVEGGVHQAKRGAEGAPQTELNWSLDAPLTLLLRPQSQVEGTLRLDAHIQDQTGAWRALPLSAQSAPSGAFEVQTSVRKLFQSPGRYELRLIISRSGRSLPESAQVISRSVRVLEAVKLAP